jgi:hypothetical protein
MLLSVFMDLDYPRPNPSPKLVEGLPVIGVFGRLYRLKTATSLPPSWEGGKQGGWEPCNPAVKRIIQNCQVTKKLNTF